ncbi:hypothetical protein ACSBR2_016042 [Camellia fascicularis]
METEPLPYGWNVENITEPSTLDWILENMFSNLMTVAISDPSVFAISGEISVTDLFCAPSCGTRQLHHNLNLNHHHHQRWRQ